MKIAMSVTVEVDRDAWDLEYRCGAGRDAVRADVVQYVRTALQGMCGDDDPGEAPAIRLVSIHTNGRESK